MKAKHGRKPGKVAKGKRGRPVGRGKVTLKWRGRLAGKAAKAPKKTTRKRQAHDAGTKREDACESGEGVRGAEGSAEGMI